MGRWGAGVPNSGSLPSGDGHYNPERAQMPLASGALNSWVEMSSEGGTADGWEAQDLGSIVTLSSSSL